MQHITAKQEQIFKYLRSFTEEKGYPPSVREICKGIGLKSPSSVHAHLKALENAGYIKRDANKTRAMIVNAPSAANIHPVSVPILGQVAAGSPVLAVEDIEGYIPFDPGGAEREYFALRVKGDSMINVGIFSGDQIFVQSCNTARNGDTVVALVDDSATVKTFYKENGYIRLQPENDSMDPIIVDDCQILGKVYGVFRLFH